jgi:exocyst complex protein 7
VINVSDETPNFGSGTTSTSGGSLGSGGGVGSASKSQAKERFTRFYDILEEVVERHRMGRVLVCDDDLSLDFEGAMGGYEVDEIQVKRERDCLKDERREVEEEVVKLVIPPLKKFVTRMREKYFGRSE